MSLNSPRPAVVTKLRHRDAAAFLELPRKLYSCAVTSRATEQALLRAEHPLSTHFEFHPRVIRSGGEPLGRCAVTLPPEGPAYVGLFESVDDAAVAGDLLSWAVDQARAAGRPALIGPVDASFWLRYRLKLDHFDRRPYLNEPYNRGYY
ncbi:MAG: hypothetical protein LBV30_02290, partial [Propionibacteriaceae bacterium]|nr:hypothetical protein [Propionibacteriaceae bacterium]